MAHVVVRAPTAHGEALLLRRDAGASGSQPVLELRVNGIFVMDTEHTHAEQLLAREALAACVEPRRVLVGGLGLGFTVATLLADERVEALVVAEIEPAVIAWVRDGLVPHTAGVLDDPRVDVRASDVLDVLASSPPGSFDAVILDVDNGPDQLVHEANAWLYQSAALTRCLLACAPGGALGIWSAEHSPALLDRLSRLGSSARHVPVEVRLQGRQAHYHLYVTRPDRR